MTEKFDFAKSEDQERFGKIDPKEKERIKSDAQEIAIEAEKMMEQHQSSNYEGAIRMSEARINWKKKGNLGVTAEDHRAFGGTPQLELSQNPGKTFGELWDVEKIRTELEKLVKFLEKARKEYKGYEKDKNHPDAHWSKDNIVYAKEELQSTIPYLKSIDKLPKEFEDFEVHNLKNDPV